MWENLVVKWFPWHARPLGCQLSAGSSAERLPSINFLAIFAGSAAVFLEALMLLLTKRHRLSPAEVAHNRSSLAAAAAAAAKVDRDRCRVIKEY